MSTRENYGGMDYQWDNRTGPIGQSGFGQIAQKYGMQNTPSRRQSPQKHTPSLHQSSPNKPLPPRPAMFDAKFSTPRKTEINDNDDSSAGETPKSPEQTDNDHTPDTLGRSMLGAFSFSKPAPATYDGVDLSQSLGGADRERGSPTKEKTRPEFVRRESWIVRNFKKHLSPGRGEVPRGADYSHAKDSRVKKMDRSLQRHRSKKRRHSMSDSGEDYAVAAPRSPRKASAQKKEGADQTSEKGPHWMTSLFKFIASHPTVPHILSWYVQLAFNFFLAAGCIWAIYCFWSAVQGDVDKKAHEAMLGIMAEMAVCGKSYNANNCDPAKRVPALDTVCENWYKCMNQDPSKVGRARVSAHTFAEIFNSFVEPISWKTMIFIVSIVFGGFATSNMAFGALRQKAEQHHWPPPNYYQPPQTPQRSFGGQTPYHTPWHNMPQMEPQPSQVFSQIEGQRSPVRQLTQAEYNRKDR